MTGGVNCGGGHRTRLRDCLFYFGVPPGHVHKGEGREAGGQEGRAMGGVLLGLLVQVGFGPPFSFLPPEGIGRRGRGKGKGGYAPSSMSYSNSLGGGCAPPPWASLSLPSLFPLRWEEGGGRILLGLGVQVGLPPWRALLGLRPPPPLLYIRGQGAPQSTIDNLLAVCGSPSIVYSSGHSVVVLRRSLARIASPSSSPRRRADGTLP